MYGATSYDAQWTSRPAPRPGLAVTAWVMVAIGVLIGATIWGEYGSNGPTTWLATDIAVGVASCALLPVLLRWPVAGAVALAVLAAISPAATPPATVGTLHVAQRRRFAVALAVGAVGAAAHIVRWAWRPVDGLTLTWWVVLVLVAHAALIGWGAQTRTRGALLASLRGRAERAEAEQGRRVAEARALERARIAAEMHDVLAHRLSLLATYAGALEYRPDAPPEQLARAAGVVRTGVHQALGELRDVMSLLHDDDGHPAGDAAERPQPVLADLAALVTESRDAGMHVALDDQVSNPSALPAATGRTAYRVVREALTNARKHAAGQPVRVRLDGAPGTGLIIDVGNPLAPDRSAAPTVPGTGTGLVGLTERVALAGGRLDHQTTADGEFRLHARLPWPA